MILFNFFFVKCSLCIKHLMDCISKSSSLTDFMAVAKFHLFLFVSVSFLWTDSEILICIQTRVQVE